MNCLLTSANCNIDCNFGNSDYVIKHTGILSQKLNNELAILFPANEKKNAYFW